MDQSTDYIGADTERQYLLEVYPDGHMVIKTRVQSWETWGPGVVMRPGVQS